MRYGHAHSAVNCKLFMPHLYVRRLRGIQMRRLRGTGKALHSTSLGTALSCITLTRCVCCKSLVLLHPHEVCVLHHPHEVCVLLSSSMTQAALATSKLACVTIFGLDACFGRASSILRRAEWCGYCGVWSRGLDGLRTRPHWCMMTRRCSSSGKPTGPVASLPVPLLRVCLTPPSVWCIVYPSAFPIFHFVNKEWCSESRVVRVTKPTTMPQRVGVLPCLPCLAWFARHDQTS